MKSWEVNLRRKNCKLKSRKIYLSPANSPPTVAQPDVEEVVHQESQQPTPTHENDKNDVCSSHESQPPSQPVVSSGEPTSIESLPSPPADTIQDSSKSTSFARIILAKPSDRIKSQADQVEKNDWEEGLVDFLLRSGLFSVG